MIVNIQWKPIHCKYTFTKKKVICFYITILQLKILIKVGNSHLLLGNAPVWSPREFQRWSTPIQKLSALTSAISALIFPETTLIPSKIALNSADFCRIQKIIFQFIFHFSPIFTYLNFETWNSIFQPTLTKEANNGSLGVQAFCRLIFKFSVLPK